MLSKSTAKMFFLWGTALCSGAFLLLTVDTLKQIPKQTNQSEMNESVIRGKHLWDTNNCMGCHTIMGEGAYYAPELTKVYERRGPQFIKAMLTDPQSVYPGQRKMVKYPFNEQQKEDLVEFLRWIGKIDLNGFPAKPVLGNVAVSNTTGDFTATRIDRPQVFNQMCIACHALGGQGGNVGPALDGIGSRKDPQFLAAWLTDPIAIKADAKMPKLPLSPAEIAELTAYLSQQKSQ